MTTPFPIGDIEFRVSAGPADQLYNPPIVSTQVDLHGCYTTISIAAMAIEAAGHTILDVLPPHPCAPPQGSYHAAIVLNGRVPSATLNTILVATFGPACERYTPTADTPSTVFGPGLPGLT